MRIRVPKNNRFIVTFRKIFKRDIQFRNTVLISLCIPPNLFNLKDPSHILAYSTDPSVFLYFKAKIA